MVGARRARRGVARVGVLVALASAVAAVPASADSPEPGKRYDGRSSTGQRVFFRLSDDGRRIAAYDVVARMRCSDGRRRVLGLNSIRERRVRVAADGSFSGRGRPGRVRLGRVVGRAATTFTGQFTGADDGVTGTITARFTRRGLRCASRGSTYRAFEDGTTNAPFRDERMATGRYDARGFGTLRFTTFAPSPSIDRVTFQWRIRCGRGAINLGTISTGILVRPNGRFARGGRISNVRVGRQFRLSYSFRIAGRFSYRGAYRVRGSFRARGVVRRNGRRIDRCRVRGGRFAGRFVRGPSGPGNVH